MRGENRKQCGLQDQASDLRRSGFTLVEVVLTVLIMSLLLVGMAELLTATRRSRDTIHNVQENMLSGPAIMDLIERDLRGLILTGLSRDQHLRVVNRVLSGLDADSIDFVTSTDAMRLVFENDRVVRSDWGEVGYRLRPAPDDDFLEIYRREAASVDSAEGEAFDEGGYIFLHDRVKGFDILVYMEDGPEAEPVDEWNMDPSDPQTQGLPARLEMTLTLELEPRIDGEVLPMSALNRVTMEYKRIIRLPESLRLAEGEMPLIGIPSQDSGEGEESGEGTAGEQGQGSGVGGPGAPGAPAGGSTGSSTRSKGTSIQKSTGGDRGEK